MQLEIIHLEITLLMANLLKHANYLNAVQVYVPQKSTVPQNIHGY